MQCFPVFPCVSAAQAEVPSLLREKRPPGCRQAAHRGCARRARSPLPPADEGGVWWRERDTPAVEADLQTRSYRQGQGTPREDKPPGRRISRTDRPALTTHQRPFLQLVGERSTWNTHGGGAENHKIQVGSHSSLQMDPDAS